MHTNTCICTTAYSLLTRGQHDHAPTHTPVHVHGEWGGLVLNFYMSPVLTGTAIVVLIAICCTALLSPQNSGWEGHAQVAHDIGESTMEDMISGQEVCLHV